MLSGRYFNPLLARFVAHAFVIRAVQIGHDMRSPRPWRVLTTRRGANAGTYLMAQGGPSRDSDPKVGGARQGSPTSSIPTCVVYFRSGFVNEKCE